MSIKETLQNSVANGSKSLGDIITWSAGHDDVTYADIQDALAKAGMDAKFSKELCPRYAFSRACKELEQDRVIRKVREGEQHLYFQFTKEVHNHSTDRIDYNFELILVLDKKTGKVQCDSHPDMAVLAEKMVQDAREKRTSSDVTKIVQRMFATHADLFPVREQGGCYFVPLMHVPFVQRVETFLTAIGGHINRFPVLAGEGNYGKQSVKTIVAQGLASMLEDHLQAIENLGESTLDGTFERRYEAIENTAYKIEGYAYYLEEQSAGLLESLQMAKAKLAEAKLKLVDQMAA